MPAENHRQSTSPLRRAARRILSHVPLGLRYGPEFRETTRFLDESQWWSRDRLQTYQVERLRELVSLAHAATPYYRTLLDRHGLAAEDIHGLEDLRRFPLVTKDTVRRHGDAMVPGTISEAQRLRVTTGGTSGPPMTVTWQRRVTAAREWAFVWRSWGWAGYRPGQRRVVLRGSVPRDRPGVTNPYWEEDTRNRRLFLSAYQMTPELLPAYVSRMRAFRPRALQAYPSALAHLVQHLRRAGGAIEGLRCVFTSSETLYPRQRAQIEGVLGVRVYDHYGLTERCGLVMQCEAGRYHVIPEYGILELLDAEGRPVERVGEVGEIVLTGFTNPALPLIRYRTGDLAARGASDCTCGRQHDLLERVEGRRQDHFRGLDGSWISALCSDEPLWDLPDPIEAYQYAQEEAGRVVLDIEAAGGLSPASEEHLRRQFHAFFPQLEIEIRRVPRIPRTERGKFRFVVQSVRAEGATGERDV